MTRTTPNGSHGRLIHHVPGRLRIRWPDGVSPEQVGGLGAVRVAPGVVAVDVRPAARSVVVRYTPRETTLESVLAAFAAAGVPIDDGTNSQDRTGSAEATSASGNPPTEGSTLRELLIGPPPKLDRRFAESLALSLVSVVGARQVGLALGGGMTLPAYFIIWLTLRRLTGAGRRR